jgi:hypothetical protein
MPSSTAATLGSGANRVGVPLLLPGRRGAQSLPRLNRLVRKRVPGVVRRVPLRLAGWLLAGIPTVSSAQDEPAWFPALQAADGRWPAKDVDIADPADVRVSAWMALSLAGEGCSLGRGGLSAQLRSTVHWLLAQQDGQGRIGLRADCDWLLDHAMATYALCEATFDSRSANAAGPVLAAVAALQREVLRMRPAPGVELRLWGELVAKSLRVRAERATKQDPPPMDAERRTLAERKEAGATLLWNLERLPPLPPLDADAPVRERAAQTLRAALAVEFHEIGDVLACWPEDPVAEPLTAFYTLSAAYCSGDPSWKRLCKQVTQSVVRGQVTSGEHKGTFAPAGEFGAANGRAGTSALCVMQMEVYYRYCQLSLFEE